MLAISPFLHDLKRHRAMRQLRHSLVRQDTMRQHGRNILQRHDTLKLYNSRIQPPASTIASASFTRNPTACHERV